MPVPYQVPVTPPTALVDRLWLSAYSILPPDATFVLHVAGAISDPDGAVVVDMLNEMTQDYVFEGRVATRMAEGVYWVPLQSADTSVPGLYTFIWRFVIDGDPQIGQTYIEVGQPSPAYDALSGDMQGVVEAVWNRFEDLFDSPLGGPHLQVYFQTRMNRNRLAQMVRTAVGTLNTVAQPHQTYSIDPGGKAFPVAEWGPLLEQGAYIETIKHLIRSYTEQPVVDGVPTARLDRRDYQQRWQTVLEMEMPEYRSMLETFKIANMGLGTPRVLVAGGIYGNGWGSSYLVGRSRWGVRYF